MILLSVIMMGGVLEWHTKFQMIAFLAALVQQNVL